jgi:ribosomal protein S1
MKIMNKPLAIPSLRFQAHWQNAQSQRYNQILPKSLPAHPTQSHEQKDNAAKRKDKLTGKINNETPTSCIVHLADGTNFKGVTSNKRCNGLTGSCFESPNDTIHVTVVRKPKKRHSSNMIADLKKKKNGKRHPTKARVWQPIPATVPSLPNTCFFCQRTRISMILLD